MPPASMFLLFGLLAAVVLSFGAWFIRRPRRSPLSSVDDFRTVMRAIAPRTERTP